MQSQTFNDGLIDIYKVTNIAEAGNKQKNRLELKRSKLRYQERTVGMSRFYTAMQVNAKIQLLLRVQRVNGIAIDDIVVCNGEQYQIVQLQNIRGIEPKVMDLSLVKVGVNYEFKAV